MKYELLVIAIGLINTSYVGEKYGCKIICERILPGAGDADG